MFPRSPSSTALCVSRRSSRVRVLLLALAMLVGLTAGALVQPGAAGASVPPRTDKEKRIDWAILAIINHERAMHGLRPVHMAPALRLSARRHNVTMAKWDEMSHQLPGEPVFTTRMVNAGYYWSWAGENIAWNSEMTLSGAALLERLMYHETPPENGHRLNILNSHFRNVGVDIYLDKVHHKLWLTTDFGHRA
jgi:uncharacterized protein YkwD